MPRTSNENQLNLALQAIQRDSSLNIRHAALIYTINYITLSWRKRGMPSSHNYIPKTCNFIDLKKNAIVYWILELNVQRFFLKFQNMEDMANKLWHNCNTSFIRKNWTLTFISCHLKLKTTFSRKYDYQQTLCKDSKIINE